MDDHCITGLDSVPNEARGGVLTVGNFDGVHLGHQRIVTTARGLADAEGSAVTALTFDPPPDLLLHPDHAGRRITTHQQRCWLLRQAGADWVVTARTDSTLLAMTAEAFIKEAIVDKFAPRHIVEGDNFFFGKGREGNVRTLQQWQKRGSFTVHVIEPVTLDFADGPRRVSSSLVRQFIAAGRVEDAARCLGRPFALSGEIIPGQGKGRVLQFPTANIDPGQQVCPADGIYAGMATIEGKTFVVAISIGNKPTLGPIDYSVVEAYLLDAQGDYYGRQIELGFIARLRDQQKFDSLEALQEQIAKDVEHVRQIIR